MFEGGPPPADTCGVEALGGSSKKFGSWASAAGGAVANGTAWTGDEGACCVGDEGGGAGVDGGVEVGRGGGAGGEDGATLFLFVTRPSSVTSSSSSSSSWTTWGAFLLGLLRTNLLRWAVSFGGDRPWTMAASTTEFGTVWEPLANPWFRASVFNSESMFLGNMSSAWNENARVNSRETNKCISVIKQQSR